MSMPEIEIRDCNSGYTCGVYVDGKLRKYFNTRQEAEILATTIETVNENIVAPKTKTADTEKNKPTVKKKVFLTVRDREYI